MGYCNRTETLDIKMSQPFLFTPQYTPSPPPAFPRMAPAAESTVSEEESWDNPPENSCSCFSDVLWEVHGCKGAIGQQWIGPIGNGTGKVRVPKVFHNGKSLSTSSTPLLYHSLCSHPTQVQLPASHIIHWLDNLRESFILLWSPHELSEGCPTPADLIR